MNSYTNQQNAYRKASVNTLDQNKLIVMLYDGAIKQAGFAVEHIKKNEIEKAHNALVKAKNIVSELMSSLNMEKGGEVAKNLKSLYAFMFSQLIEANMNKESKPVVTVIGLLKELLMSDENFKFPQDALDTVFKQMLGQDIGNVDPECIIDTEQFIKSLRGEFVDMAAKTLSR